MKQSLSYRMMITSSCLVSFAAVISFGSSSSRDPPLFIILLLTWIFSASLNSRFSNSWPKKRYLFQAELIVTFQCFLVPGISRSHKLLYFRSHIGLGRDLIFIRLRGACWSNTSTNSVLKVSACASMSSSYGPARALIKTLGKVTWWGPDGLTWAGRKNPSSPARKPSGPPR